MCLPSAPRLDLMAIETVEFPPSIFFRISVSSRGCRTAATHHVLKRHRDFQTLVECLARELPQCGLTPAPYAHGESEVIGPRYRLELMAFLLRLQESPEEILRSGSFREFFHLTTVDDRWSAAGVPKLEIPIVSCGGDALLESVRSSITEGTVASSSDLNSATFKGALNFSQKRQHVLSMRTSPTTWTPTSSPPSSLASSPAASPPPTARIISNLLQEWQRPPVATPPIKTHMRRRLSAALEDVQDRLAVDSPLNLALESIRSPLVFQAPRQKRPEDAQLSVTSVAEQQRT